MPGMEDEPSSSFDDLSVLMSKLGLVATETDEPDDGGRGGEGDSEAGTSTSWRDVSSSGSSSSARTERGRGRHDDDHPPHSVDSTWREERNKKTPEIGKGPLPANFNDYFLLANVDWLSPLMIAHVASIYNRKAAQFLLYN